MKIKFICPSWQRLEYQTHYVLPPLGLTVVAALTPAHHEVVLEDENVESIDFDEPVDLVGISTMLVSQAPRAFEVADEFRARGVPVVIGGLTASCIPEQAARHADAVVVGEAEGIWPVLLEDLERGELKPLYRRSEFVNATETPRARRADAPGWRSPRSIRSRRRGYPDEFVPDCGRGTAYRARPVGNRYQRRRGVRGW